MSVGAVALIVMLAAAATFALVGISQLGRQSGQAIDLEDYMVSRNQVGGPMALATVTASALGAWILFSPPEAGSAFGGLTAILGYCVGSAAAVLTFVFVGPRLRQIMPWGHSLNEYVRYRFGAVPLGLSQAGSQAGSQSGGQTGGSIGKAMYWLTVVVMLLYMFVYLAAELTAIAQVLQLVADVPLLVTSLVVITAVFLYTAYGGLKVTIITDALQFALIVPLLLICFGMTIALLGGFGAAFGPVAEKLPELLSLGNIDGLRFGATLIIAVVAAELFNQGNWQRVYACRSDQTVRRSFLGSALVILPLLFLSGLLGLIAAGFDLSGTTAFFDLLQSLNIPLWLLGAVILLAMALVMSSMDTLLNGISAVFTGDLLRLSNQPSRVLLISRLLTVAVGIPAVAIASQGYSVLYLFFIADLLCAALLFPVVFSFYSRYQTASNAFWSSLAGIAVGVLFFPKPDFSPLVNVPGGGDLLNSFAAALLTSMAISLLWNAVSKSKAAKSKTAPFNYGDLKNVRSYTASSQPSEATPSGR
ncbi:MAG: sodium:solute symporter family transporter [Phormidesmis sp.]